MIYSEFDFGSPMYADSIFLRDEILRKPLKMVFHADDLAKEFDSHHLGAIHSIHGLIACLVLVPKAKGVYKMRQVAVDECVQGKGIGTQLVKFSEDFLIEKGAKKIVLNAREKAVQFYKRMGYTTVGERFIEVSIPHFTMEKVLIS